VSKLDPTKITSVYDVTLVADLGSGSLAPPTLTSALCGRQTEANMYIRKFALEDIPKVRFRILALVPFALLFDIFFKPELDLVFKAPVPVVYGTGTGYIIGIFIVGRFHN
jgi:hypothetical protein